MATVEVERIAGEDDSGLILNMGPQHPSTHGVLRVILKMDGEYIEEAVPIIGYLHRGTEKIAESETYTQILGYTDRMDYTAAASSNLGWLVAVETLAGIEVPDRAQWLRCIVGELGRLAGHFVWIGTHALDIGAMSVFLYAFRARERVLELFEELCGARMTHSVMRPGGFLEEPREPFYEKLEGSLDYFIKEINQFDKLLSKNDLWLGRTVDVGVISGDDAIAMGLSGACLRGSGVEWDIRKAEPYAAYDKVEFDIPTGTGKGDVYSRYLLRLEEMRQSVRILRQVIERLPPGPVMTDDSRVARPDTPRLYTDMEAMINHFWMYIHGFPVPRGETYVAIEAPKGELGFYVVSDGSGKPYRMHVRSPSFVNLQSLPYLVKGRLLADVVSVIGSIDIVLGEIDR
jgi:NADH dehydrogenase I D subunit